MSYIVNCLDSHMAITSVELALECVPKNKGILWNGDCYTAEEALAAAKAKGHEAQVELLSNLLEECSFGLDHEGGDGYEAIIDPYEVETLYSVEEKLLEDIAPAMLDGSYVVFNEIYGDSFKVSYRNGKASWDSIDYSCV